MTLSLKRQLFGLESESIDALCAMIMASDGEYSSLVIAERILTAYEQLDAEGRIDFFRLLATTYDVDPDAIEKALHNYRTERGATELKRLCEASEPGRQSLFRRLNMAVGGTTRLVAMRGHLLDLIKIHPELAAIDVDLRHLFSSWFNRGFLVLQPIDWTTPAHILEKIIAYEAVHEIHSWAELRRRLEPPDRHCFAFFHPAMEDEPLVFVEVALADNLPDRINQILDSDREVLDPARTSCAIFYSISSCHRGLTGISFGNFLIKQVAINLQMRFPHLKKFATLSPAPGFRRWLEQQHPEALAQLDHPAPSGQDNESGSTTVAGQTLTKLAASYYLHAKGRDEEPADPVARFHLKNGAELHRINADADRSTNGVAQSLGLMVNYLYDLSKVEDNHEAYMKQRKIACSPQIRKLATAAG